MANSKAMTPLARGLCMGKDDAYALYYGSRGDITMPSPNSWLGITRSMRRHSSHPAAPVPGQDPRSAVQHLHVCWLSVEAKSLGSYLSPDLVNIFGRDSSPWYPDLSSQRLTWGMASRRWILLTQTMMKQQTEMKPKYCRPISPVLPRQTCVTMKAQRAHIASHRSHLSRHHPQEQYHCLQTQVLRTTR